MKKIKTPLVMLILCIITLSALIRAEFVINEPTAKAFDYEKYLKVETLKGGDYALYDVPLTAEQQREVQKICKKYAIPYEIALGIMKVESDFNIKAENGLCKGIMQVSTINQLQYRVDFAELGIKDLKQLYQGIEAGCYVFAQCKGENIEQRLIAYNEGQTAANELIKKGISSTAYSRKVLDYANNL